MMEHTIYYSPYDTKALVHYGRKNKDWQMVYMEGECDMSDTDLDKEGNIILKGIHDYPKREHVKISGKLYWQKPIYKQRLVLYEINKEQGLRRYEILDRIREISEKKFDEWIKDFDEYYNDETMEYRLGLQVIKKER